MMKTMSKILVVDIEWSPATAYVWRMWDENISPAQLIDAGGLLCFCAHWVGSKDFIFRSEWEHGKHDMALVLRDLLDEADAVVTYNGNRYDLPKIRGHLMLEGLVPFAPPTSIDLIKTVKGLGFVMNKLAYIAPLLGVGEKMKHEGFSLWRSVLEGDVKAQKRMQKYCIQDVRVTTRLYRQILPYIDNHPHLGDNKGKCGSCGSDHVQMRGFRRTKFFKVQRLQCQDCGSWSTGKRIKA
jgi:hypothetical protein